MGEERGHRRGDERLALAAADDQRALAPRADEHVGLVERDRDEREVAVELAERREHRLGEVVAVVRAAIRCAITSASVSVAKIAPLRAQPLA